MHHVRSHLVALDWADKLEREVCACALAFVFAMVRGRSSTGGASASGTAKSKADAKDGGSAKKRRGAGVGAGDGELVDCIVPDFDSHLELVKGLLTHGSQNELVHRSRLVSHMCYDSHEIHLRVSTFVSKQFTQNGFWDSTGHQRTKVPMADLARTWPLRKTHRLPASIMYLHR
jgi:hypothetical protein